MTRQGLNHPATWLGLVLVLFISSAGAGSPASDALRTRFASARQQALRIVVDKQVFLQSAEVSGRLQGEVYALLDHPFDDISHTLGRADHWCDILILHLNVKYCRASPGGPAEVLDAGLGRKFDQALSDVYWVRFSYRATSSDGFLAVVLQAPDGPLGTSDYRIEVQATPSSASQTILHMRYGYTYGLSARLAMQAYLATLGSDKVGFSVIGQRSDGQPLQVRGVRGVVERNTLRYYLAIDAFLEAQALPATQQLQASLQGWFTATERYAQQLHEVDRDTYVGMKLREVQRQRTQTAPAAKP